MKRLYFLAVFTLLTLSAMRAQDARLMQLQKTIETGYSNFRELLHSGQYQKAEAPILELINLLDTTTIWQVEALQIPQQALCTQKAVYQYDLACCYALQGKKKQALQTLEQSAKNGYLDYQNMLNDNDLKSLRKQKQYQQALALVKSRLPIEVLKHSNAYNFQDTTTIPVFQYQPTEHPNLQLVREYFQLDTISGKDNELEHIKNLLHFAHDNIRHDGGNRAVCEFTSIDIYNYTHSTGRGVNCRQLALSLCDMYLAMGYKARVVTCLPADPNDFECHVINTVWSETLQKWLYIDPTMDAWVMDESGHMLSIQEVRDRLVDGRPLQLCPTANWNHEQDQSKEYYLEKYMAKNLYYFVCKERSFFNQESIYRSTNNQDVRLIPVGFENDNYNCATTTNPNHFWTKPE